MKRSKQRNRKNNETEVGHTYHMHKETEIGRKTKKN
jgi:hypothetical protein